MKHYLFTAFLALSFTPTLLAQTKAKKHPNLFDTTLARKHELIIAPGFTAHSIWNDGIVSPAGGSLSIEYARVYKANHFLRTGIRFAQDRTGGNRTLDLPAKPVSDPSYPGQYPPPVYPSNQFTSNHSQNNVFAGLFVGYEYGIGKRRLRFTFGADINIGYNHISISERESWFAINQTYDMVTNTYSYNVQGYRDGSITSSGHYIYMALTPRLGIRRDLGRRIALAIAFTPQIGYVQRLGYSETLTGDRPYYYYAPKSMWFAKANADLRLIIKLGKS